MSGYIAVNDLSWQLSVSFLALRSTYRISEASLQTLLDHKGSDLISGLII